MNRHLLDLLSMSRKLQVPAFKIYLRLGVTHHPVMSFLPVIHHNLTIAERYPIDSYRRVGNEPTRHRFKLLQPAFIYYFVLD
jgi:hypothetical protein